MENPKVKAVLFDLDGTIVHFDTDWKEEIAAAKKFASKHGIALEKTGISDIFYEVKAKLRHERDRKEYTRMLVEHERKVVDRGGISLYPGAKDILRKVKFARVKTALVTNNLHETAERILEHFNLREYFDQIICWDDVDVPKPSPEGINEVLRRLKVKPEEALFVGDGRVTDLEAAQAAGVDAVIIDRGK